jgi:hypothetical protein
MSTYIIEGNLNFQEELYKLLDEETDNEDELCQITGLQLDDKYVMLECKHHFNYDTLYREICKQKYEFKTYERNSLTNKDQQKVHDSKLDYFIKCPYCRNIQFTILPYYKELGLAELYGINSLDKNLLNTIIMNNSRKPCSSFNIHGITFIHGKSCKKINEFGYNCSSKYVATIPNTNLDYCNAHYKGGLKSYKMDEKKKIMDIKILAKKEKENKLNEKKKLLEEKNCERTEKGLPPLKRLIIIQKKIENIVEQQKETIQNYIPEEHLKRLLIIKKKIENVVEQQKETIQNYIPEEQLGCMELLKSGPNKGKRCGCKKIDTNSLCKRHSTNTKEPAINELKFHKNVL